MNAALAVRVDTPERYPAKSVQERARLIRAETGFAVRLQRAGLNHANWRCHVCHTGRVLVRLVEQTGRVSNTPTTGKCSTPGCLDWED
jgi:hypothetical protein